MRSLVTELTVPCGSWPGAQKKCFGLVRSELAGAAAEAPMLTTTATTAASARRLRPARVDEIQLLVLLVRGIRVVVLPDEAIAGMPSGVGVDTERGDPEVIADRRPRRICVIDVGDRYVDQRGVSGGHEPDSSGHGSYPS